ncbi:LysR family transcriptional regulator [Pseudomonas fontis]|uniref:LysR substrate-binding domain-containing protein n=1 Tax=Pseudomonas fontis TaxID=2942633 RepID=A0ABT5NVB4_9PSED|nr:LysR substrate-binding domain-containing protein [Pseudomonas fontis]MDD0974197.1 LysR substrate-binding domain-containing protein [Pseudomonas fontis]MDD0992077.1 LysR substrate-binding domain-containing protein [Pseudomonas fontis]
MTLTQLEIFSQVAQLRGFTRAALRLGISQSAVSHAIKALEQELGVSLFERHASGLALTPIGEQLLQRARAMLGLAATMGQEAADSRGMKQGTLRIGSFGPSASIRLLPAMLQAFRQQAPGIEVHIDEGPDRDVLQWLLERRIDVGFVVLPQTSFHTFPLLEDQMVALLPAGHALCAEPAVSLKALCEDPFILSQAGSAELVESLFQSAGVRPNIRYRSGQLLSTLETVARGDALSVVAELSLPEAGAGPARYQTRPLAPKVRRKIGLAVLDPAQASPATLAFITLAQSLCAER